MDLVCTLQNANAFHMVCLWEKISSAKTQDGVMVFCRIVGRTSNDLTNISCLCVDIARHIYDQFGSESEKLLYKVFIASASRGINDDSCLLAWESDVLYDRSLDKRMQIQTTLTLNISIASPARKSTLSTSFKAAFSFANRIES